MIVINSSSVTREEKTILSIPRLDDLDTYNGHQLTARRPLIRSRFATFATDTCYCTAQGLGREMALELARLGCSMLEAFLPKMLERGKGHVVGIASCGGLEVLPDASLYCATKFAVVGLMKTLAEEFRLRSENIKFTCVIPALEAKETAISIVKGIRQELSIFTVPSSFYGMFLFQSILPKKIQELMRGVIYARVSSREDEHNSTTDKKVP
ncbi:hypothetical protein C0J52_24431 [Blattella germanica]|nr:hypothetical protein C0J52_24431 [Blattella germanica]